MEVSFIFIKVVNEKLPNVRFFSCQCHHVNLIRIVLEFAIKSSVVTQPNDSSDMYM